MEVKFEYTIIGQFNIPSLTKEEAKKSIDKILSDGNIDLIVQGKKYIKYKIIESDIICVVCRSNNIKSFGGGIYQCDFCKNTKNF